MKIKSHHLAKGCLILMDNEDTWTMKTSTIDLEKGVKREEINRRGILRSKMGLLRKIIK